MNCNTTEQCTGGSFYELLKQ